MYRVTINGKKKEIEAEGLSIENGTLLFFSDKANSQIIYVISAGKWDSLEVLEGSEPLQMRKGAPVQPKAIEPAEEPAFDVNDLMKNCKVLEEPASE